MPRQSAESRSAAAFRSGGAPPKAPAHLSKDAKAVWTKIAASKPPDWFDEGAQVLLERYCEATIQARRVARKLDTLMKAGAWRDAREFEKRFALLSTTLTTLATKLRLSVQSTVDRHSRKLGEKGNGAPKDGQPDTLLGGAAVWGDQARAN